MDKMALTIWVVIFGCVMGAIAGSIAERKNRSFMGWFALGFLLNVIAVMFISIATTDREKFEENELAAGRMKVCPYCTSIIKTAATKCRYCTSDLPIEEQPVEQQESPNDSPTDNTQAEENTAS